MLTKSLLWRSVPYKVHHHKMEPHADHQLLETFYLHKKKKSRDETISFYFFICLFVSFYFAFLKILQPMTRYQQVCSHVPFIHLSLGWIMHLDYKRKKSCQRVRMLTIRFKPFLSMKITLQHSFIVKHITHWFWYDNIYHLWNLYLQKKKKRKKNQEIVNSKACKRVNCFLQSLIHFWQQSRSALILSHFARGNFYLELNWNLPLQLFQESQSPCLKDYYVWPKPTNKICKKIVYFHERVHISWGEVTTCN